MVNSFSCTVIFQLTLFHEDSKLWKQLGEDNKSKKGSSKKKSKKTKKNQDAPIPTETANPCELAVSMQQKQAKLLIQQQQQLLTPEMRKTLHRLDRNPLEVITYVK